MLAWRDIPNAACLTRRALLLAACAAFVPDTAEARRRRIIMIRKRAKLSTPPPAPPVDNQPHVVRTISIRPSFNDLWNERIGR